MKVEIIGGGFGLHENGRVRLVTSGIVEVPEDVARALVESKSARYVTEEPKRHGEDCSIAVEETEDATSEQLDRMSINELRGLAKSVGVRVEKTMRKDELIAAIAEVNSSPVIQAGAPE